MLRGKGRTWQHQTSHAPGFSWQGPYHTYVAEGPGDRNDELGFACERVQGT